VFRALGNEHPAVQDVCVVVARSVNRTRSRDLESVLLQAADHVLRRDGLDGVTVRSVATEAGVAPMGVYSRFGSKEGLVDALLIQAIDDLQRAVASRGEPEPAERLRSSARRYRQWALANPQHYQAIFLSRRGMGSAEVAEHLAGVYEVGYTMHEYAMAHGVIKAGDPKEACARFWCATHGAIAFELHSLVLPEDADRNFEAVLDMVMQGLSAPPLAP
jgi:AcrR family transcriptional regulator